MDGRRVGTVTGVAPVVPLGTARADLDPAAATTPSDALPGPFSFHGRTRTVARLPSNHHAAEVAAVVG